MPFCTNCGHRNPDEANFCSQCGTRLESAEPSVESTATTSIAGVSDAAAKSDTSDRQLNAVDAAAVDALPTGHALLVVQRGPGSGSRFLLDKDVISAGRQPDSDIFLDDVTVSRRHVEFRREGEIFSVHDVGSLNGTYVNREPVDSAALAGGDEVQIGKFRLVFLTGRRSSGGEAATEEAR